MNRGSGLKRGKPIPKMSARRLREFEALGVRPASTLDKPGQKRTPMQQRYTDTGPDKETVELVRKRDKWRCACCGDKTYGRRGIEWCIAHRKLRSRGGDNRASNLYLSCGNGTAGCEGQTHAHPERAEAAGYMVPSTEDPATVPMEHAVLGHGLLDDDGGFTRVESEASA